MVRLPHLVEGWLAGFPEQLGDVIRYRIAWRRTFREAAGWDVAALEG